jgi:Flp pilus assembly pilin Flp
MTKRTIADLVRDTRGGDFLEYIIVCGVVALVAVAAFTAFGGDVQSKIKEEGAKVMQIQD